MKKGNLDKIKGHRLVMTVFFVLVQLGLIISWQTGFGQPTVSFIEATQSSFDEGGTISIIVELSEVSSSDVTIPFTVDASSTAYGSGTDYIIDASPLVISAGDLSEAIDITITADGVPENDETVVVNMGTPVNATQGAITTHTATITDDDIPAILISATSGLTTTESGGTATFSISVSTLPGSDVTITLSSSDTGEGTVSPSTVIFNSSNWEDEQTITVTGVDDIILDGSQTFTILTSAAVSSDADYNGINPDDVTVINSDNDAAGITVNPTTCIATNEGGGKDEFQIVLNYAPTAFVTVSITSSDTGEGTTSVSSVTFTPSNWDVPQTITVTGVDDRINDGDIDYTILVGAAVSTDLNYNGIDPADVSATNYQDGIQDQCDDATTNTTLGTGLSYADWFDPSIWSSGSVPTASSHGNWVLSECAKILAGDTVIMDLGYSTFYTDYPYALIVEGVLLLYGDVVLANGSRDYMGLKIGAGATLIIYGDFEAKNKLDLNFNSYFVVTGRVDMTGSQGEVLLKDQAQVYFMEGIQAGHDYEELECSDPSTYISGTIDDCGHGNMDAFLNNIDPWTDLFYWVVGETTTPVTNLTPDPASFCSGESVTLNVGETAAAEYIWFRNDTIVAGENTDSLVATSGGDYNCYYKLGIASWYSTNEVVVTESEKSDDPGSASASETNICLGDNVTLSLVGGGGGTDETIRWYTGSCGGTLIGTGNNLSVSPTDTTTYYGRYENGSPCNYTTSCASVTVYIDGTPPVLSDCPGDTLEFEPDVGLCSAVIDTTTWGQTVAVSATDGCDSDPTIYFVRGDGVTGSGKASFPVGNTNVTLYATDASGNTSSGCSFTILVREDVPPTITCPAGDTIFCGDNLPDAYANLTEFTSAGGSVSDNAGSGCGIENSSFTLLSEVDGGTSITRTYQISDYSGNTSTCEQVFVIDIPSVTIESQTTNTCIGDAFTITTTVTGYSGTLVYRWETRDNDVSSWSEIVGETGSSYNGTLSGFGHQYRLLVSQNDFSDANCYVSSDTLEFNDIDGPQFTTYAPGDVSLCADYGETTADANDVALESIDLVDNCTKLFASYSISYTISGATTGSGSGSVPSAFNLGTSTVDYAVADSVGNVSHHLFTVTVVEAPDLTEDIITDGLVSTNGSGYLPYQGTTHAYSVTNEAGYTYAWIVEEETSPSVYNDITSLLTITGHGTNSISIEWGENSMPGDYRITVTKTSTASGCEVSKSQDITVLNCFNPKVQDFGDACHEIDIDTRIDWVIYTEAGSVTAPEWYFSYRILLDGNPVSSLPDPIPVTVTSGDSKTISYTVIVGDGSEKNFRLEIYDVTDSLGNSETDLTDNSDDVKIYVKPTLQFQ